MNKILLLDSYKTNEANNKQVSDAKFFIKQFNDNGLIINYSSLDNLNIFVDSDSPSIYDNLNTVNLETYDAVIFRNTHILESVDTFIAVGLYLRHRNVQVLDGLEITGAFVGKLSQMILFTINGIPVPKTVMSRRNLGASIAAIGIKTPIIFKANGGIKGSKNYLINNLAQTKQIYNEHDEVFIAQEFIENDGDYRVLYMGDKQEPLIFHRRGDGKSHVNNTSKGGRALSVSVNDFDDVALSLSNKVYELSHKNLLGVDLIQDKNTKNWFVLEANTTPALYSGSFLDKKQKMFEFFLNSKSKEN